MSVVVVLGAGAQPVIPVLARLARQEELVLTCDDSTTADAVLGGLRMALPRHRAVAILVTPRAGQLPVAERELLVQLVADGVLPIVVDPDGRAVDLVARLLAADEVLAFPELAARVSG